MNPEPATQERRLTAKGKASVVPDPMTFLLQGWGRSGNLRWFELERGLGQGLGVGHPVGFPTPQPALDSSPPNRPFNVTSQSPWDRCLSRLSGSHILTPVARAHSDCGRILNTKVSLLLSERARAHTHVLEMRNANTHTQEKVCSRLRNEFRVEAAPQPKESAASQHRTSAPAAPTAKLAPVPDATPNSVTQGLPQFHLSGSEYGGGEDVWVSGQVHSAVSVSPSTAASV